MMSTTCVLCFIQFHVYFMIIKKKVLHIIISGVCKNWTKLYSQLLRQYYNVITVYYTVATVTILSMYHAVIIQASNSDHIVYSILT